MSVKGGRARWLAFVCVYAVGLVDHEGFGKKIDYKLYTHARRGCSLKQDRSPSGRCDLKPQRRGTLDETQTKHHPQALASLRCDDDKTLERG